MTQPDSDGNYSSRYPMPGTKLATVYEPAFEPPFTFYHSGDGFVAKGLPTVEAGVNEFVRLGFPPRPGPPVGLIDWNGVLVLGWVEGKWRGAGQAIAALEQNPLVDALHVVLIEIEIKQFLGVEVDD